MKNSKIYIKNIATGLILLFLISCSEDYLDRQPLDRISSNTFWKNEDQVNMALIGVYSKLYSNTFNEGRMLTFPTMAGDVSASPGNAITDIAQGQIEPTSGSIISGIYNDCYEGISAANFFLSNIDEAPISDELKAEYKGEAQFLRALFYFNLSEAYGGVPLYTNPVSIEGAKVKQSPKQEVVNQVLSDLDFAIENLPNVPYSGHAVKGTALALKAKVLLHNEQWQEAANAANQVIQDGNFSLSESYKDLFSAEGQSGNPEIMFSTRYQMPDLYNDMDIHYSWWGQLNPRQELVDEFEEVDDTLITSLPPHNVVDEPPVNWNLKRDPRLYYTIKGTEDRVINSNGDTVDFRYNNPGGTGYKPAKYMDWDELPIDYSTKSNQDWVILRYAEVLLMYAEAKNEASGPDASVYNAINTIRERVNMPEIPSDLNQSEMRERIKHERRVEFALEGKRWLDIKRWETAEDYIPTLVDPGGAERQFDPEKHYLLPFPQSEIDNNPKLEQNPGY